MITHGGTSSAISLLDHDQRTVIRALIAAMRQWQVIPRALLFDNGSPFKGMLLTTFCRKLGIRLIHSAVRHPQTNGKLERAFQDDMRDFYRQYDEWLLDHLRHDMPSYVHYRNEIRGHKALGGKPSITRLQEHTDKAPAHILAQLESYAVYKLGRQTVNSGRIYSGAGAQRPARCERVRTGSDAVRDLARAGGNDAGRALVSLP